MPEAILNVEGQSITEWALHRSAPGENLLGVAHGNGTYVAVGHRDTPYESVILTSREGTTWLPAPVRLPASTFRAVIYEREQFVAVGSIPTAGLIGTSTDGQSWSVQTVPFVYRGNLNGVVFANSLFVAVGGYLDPVASAPIFTSPDAINWTLRESNTTVPLHDVAFGNGRFVAVGGFAFGQSSTSAVLVSDDGITWRAAQFSLKPAASITFGQGKFMVVGNNGFAGPSVRTSTDGVSWSAPIQVQSSPSYQNVAFGGNQFVLSLREIWSSPNGTNWTESLQQTNALMSLSYVNGTFFALGANGVIWQSGRVAPLFDPIPPRVDANGLIHLQLKTPAGATVELQSSPWVDGPWQRVTTFTNALRSVEWMDRPDPSPSQRFYRAYLRIE